MKRLGNQLVGSIEGLYPLVGSPAGSDNAKETVRKLEKTRAVVTIVSARIAEIAPPAPVRAEHARLVRGVSALGRQLDKLIEVQEKGTLRDFGIYSHFASLITISRATKAIQKKGYAIG